MLNVLAQVKALLLRLPRCCHITIYDSYINLIHASMDGTNGSIRPATSRYDNGSIFYYVVILYNGG
jgi:hypothetical protein